MAMWEEEDMSAFDAAMARREDRFGRYLALIAWARRRYERGDNLMLVMARGDQPSRFARIEDLAAVRFLGCKERYPGQSLAGLAA